MSFEELPYFMTPKQLADVTGEHEGSITRGIREGRIPADKVNGRWRICRDVIFKNAKKGPRMTERAASSPHKAGSSPTRWHASPGS